MIAQKENFLSDLRFFKVRIDYLTEMFRFPVEPFRNERHLCVKKLLGLRGLWAVCSCGG